MVAPLPQCASRFRFPDRIQRQTSFSSAFDDRNPDMKLVVVIPALNEEATIARVVREIPTDIKGIDEMEALVVDDGSTDGTAAAGRNAGARVLSLGRNLGNGAAVAMGLEAALRIQADIIVTID